MKRHANSVAAFIVASLAVMASRTPMAADVDTLTATGLFPVHDSSGETHGDDLAWYLEPAIYQTLKERGRELLLLNPGGNYSILDDASSLEYARSTGVRSALMARFTLTSRTKPNDNSPRLQVEVRALDVTTGAVLQTFTVTEEVSRKELERGFDTGPGVHSFTLIGTPLVLGHRFYDKSRDIEKQPLGKAVRHIAESIRDNILQFNGGAAVYPSAALHQGPFPPSCAADFRVQYTRQRSASKAYELYVNGHDETTGNTNDGATSLTLKPGLNLFEVAVKDAPYRLPIQKAYSINRWIDCKAEERHLVLQIGAAGEALIVTQP